MTSFLRSAVLVLFLAVPGLLLRAAPALPAAGEGAPVAADLAEDGLAVLALAGGSGSKPFADAAAAALARAFLAAGLKPLPPAALADGPEPDAAAGAAKAASQRWAAVARVEVEGKTLSWRFSAYDAADASLRASDSFSAAAGLSSLPLLDESARSLAAAWAKSAGFGRTGPAPVEYRLSFSGGTEGAVVYLSQPSVPARAVGAIRDGRLLAAYVPLRAGEPLTVELRLEGRWSRSLVLDKGPRPEAVALPQLYVQTEHAFAPTTGFGRLLGLGLEYRGYFSPDGAYLRVENIAWGSTDFNPGAVPVLHDELRLGVGVPLWGAKDGFFRGSVGTGVSAVATLLYGGTGYSDPTGMDYLLDVFWFSIEFHRPAWAFILEERFPYSLGASSGFLPAGWASLENSGPLFLSAGVLFKW